VISTSQFLDASSGVATRIAADAAPNIGDFVLRGA